MATPRHTYLFEAGSVARPLVLLHGSYGSESDLLPLAARVAPGAPRLAVRGSVLLGDGYAFFRRTPDRRVDEEDLRSRVPALAGLVGEFLARGRFTQPPVVVGYSNGAIMAAALVASASDLFAGAVLFRPLSPFVAAAAYRRATLPVLIIDGARDGRRTPGDGQRLAEKLTGAGAVLTHRVLPVGHAMTPEDELLARDWLRSLPTDD